MHLIKRISWSHFAIAALRSGGMLLCCGLLLPAADLAYVRSQGGQFLLGNQYLERTIAIEDGHPATSQFTNKVSGKAYRISGNEFELELVREQLEYTPNAENPWRLDVRNFKLDANRVEQASDGAKRLIFSLSNQDYDPKLRVQLIYEIRPGEPFTRQWMALNTEGQGRLFIHYAAIQTNEWSGSKPRLGGFGQPIYSADLFWGLEYPSGINRFSGAAISLGSYVGVNIPTNGFTSEKAVIGVAATGKVQQAFFSYLDSIRAQPVRPYVLYNTWYDLQRMAMTGANTRERVDELNTLIQKRYKLKLDSFVLDDGWDNMKKLWEIDTGRFPNGFSGLTTALKEIGSGLGIWYGPVGGYDDRAVRIATGRSQGMEVESNSDLLCLAGRHYGEYFSNSVLNMQRQYGINFLKLDGVPFGCNDPDHGHPIGIYSREADERVFLDLLTKLRRQKPDVFLNITTGIWLSPWWLQYADTVWMGGEDSGYLSTLPTLSPRQSALSYRDSVLYDDFVRNQLQFPLSSVMTHGIIRGTYNLLGGSGESRSDWRDELVHYVSVGNMMTELYITPELLKREEWDDLAATLHWAAANRHPLLDHSKMVLGDPSRREPYAFVHASPDKVIITLRNPFARAQFVNMRLDESSGIEPSQTSYRFQTLYPYQMTEARNYAYGDTISTQLQAFEQRVLELDSDDKSKSALVIRGARASVEEKGKGLAAIHLYAPAGAKRIIEVTGNNDTKHRFEVHFGEPGRSETAVLASAPVVEQTSALETSMELKMEIPADVPKTTVALLFEPATGKAAIQAEASDNGAAVPLTIEDGKGAWQWFSLVLKPGSHKLQFKVALPSSAPKGGKLSAWAIPEKQLAEETITVSVNANVALIPASASLPAANSVEKATIDLLERSIP